MDKDFENFIKFLNNKRRLDDDIDDDNASMLNDFKYISTQRLLSLNAQYVYESSYGNGTKLNFKIHG